jgi:hypothetical protein
MNKTMKIIILFLLVVAFSYPCNSQNMNFTDVSKAVSKKHYKAGLKSKKPDEFHKLRLLLYKQYNPEFIIRSDTLFILESFHYETGEYFGQIWSTKGEVSYVYNNNQFNTDNQRIFSSYMTMLVEKWDLTSIKVEEKHNSNMLPNNPIIATRVIISNSSILIDCIRFNDFFKLERDRE